MYQPEEDEKSLWLSLRTICPLNVGDLITPSAPTVYVACRPFGKDITQLPDIWPNEPEDPDDPDEPEPDDPDDPEPDDPDEPGR